MTVRVAELLFAVILALCSIALMFKSAELNIGWIEGRGPGAGAWPFWLSAGMLLSCLATIVRWFRGITPESRSRELYLTRDSLLIVGTSAGSILGLLLMTQFAGIYIALPLFLAFYLRVIGAHRWRVALSIAVIVPLAVFALFEWALKIPLPKAFTEEWFYPVYDLMYAADAAEALRALRAPIVGLPILAGAIVVGYWAVRLLSGAERGGGAASEAAAGGSVPGAEDGAENGAPGGEDVRESERARSVPPADAPGAGPIEAAGRSARRLLDDGQG